MEYPISVFTTGQLIYTILHCLYFQNLDSSPSWVFVELNSVVNFSIAAIIGSSLPLPSRKTIDNLVVWQSLRVWARMRKYFFSL